MIRQSLIIALERLACEQIGFDPAIINFALKKLKPNAFHKKLRNELIMLPVPKINGGKKRTANGTTVNEIKTKGSHHLERAVERVSFHMQNLNCYLIVIFQLVFKSSMAPEGIFMLNSVSEILEMVGVQSIEPDEEFSIDDVDELKQAIKDNKCPVINVIKRETNEVRILKQACDMMHVF